MRKRHLEGQKRHFTLTSISSSMIAAISVNRQLFVECGRNSHDWKGMFKYKSYRGTIEWGLPKHFVQTQVDMNTIPVTKSPRLIQTITSLPFPREKGKLEYDQARVTRSMITANQRSLPEKCIGINTSEPMVRANHPSSPRIGKAFPLVVVGSISLMFQRLFDV